MLFCVLSFNQIVCQINNKYSDNDNRNQYMYITIPDNKTSLLSTIFFILVAFRFIFPLFPCGGAGQRSFDFLFFFSQFLFHLEVI